MTTAKKNITTRFKLKTSSRFSEKGFGIVEVIVSAGLMVIVAMGIAGLVASMQIEQMRVQIRGVLTDLKNKHMALLKDESAWAATVSYAPNAMGCLTTGGCAVATPARLQLRYSDGTLLPSAVNNGFTPSGAECAGFIAPPAVGIDTCPIGYSVVWEALSASINASVRITIRLVYNGSLTNKFQNSAEVSYRLTTGAYPVYTTGPAIGKNDIQIVKNATATARQFTVSQTVAAATPGGNCGVGAPGVQRNLNTKVDPTSLIGAVAGSQFSFMEEGFYKCSISAVGYSVDSFQILLKKNGVTMASSNGYAAPPNQSTAHLETAITVLAADVSGAAVYSLWQVCESAPSAVAPFPPDNRGLGNPNAGSSSFATITCTKIDE